MLTNSIHFKNFKIIKGSKKIKKDLIRLLKEKNEIINSLKISYKNSYDQKVLNN